jgi:hypothetical protein
MPWSLWQLMAGACKTLKEANCSLVGGHTSEGPEIAMGFAVNGLVEPARALRKSGLEVGDLLILTKVRGCGIAPPVCNAAFSLVFPAHQAAAILHPTEYALPLCTCLQPLGTGAIFAADMRYKARGLWVHSAIDSMVQSNKWVLFRWMGLHSRGGIVGLWNSPRSPPPLSHAHKPSGTLNIHTPLTNLFPSSHATRAPVLP